MQHLTVHERLRMASVGALVLDDLIKTDRSMTYDEFARLIDLWDGKDKFAECSVLSDILNAIEAVWRQSEPERDVEAIFKRLHRQDGTSGVSPYRLVKQYLYDPTQEENRP